MKFSGPWYLDSTRSCLDWNGLLPFHAPLTLIRCPSVYSKMIWVCRGLPFSTSFPLGVLIHIWDCHIWDLGIHSNVAVWVYERTNTVSPLVHLQQFLLRSWRRQLLCSLLRYLRSEYGADWASTPAASDDIKAGMDCIYRAGLADWWEWHGGLESTFDGGRLLTESPLGTGTLCLLKGIYHTIGVLNELY